MAREPHHGPTIDLNRIQVKRSRLKGGYAGPDGIKSVFGQMVQKSFLTKESLLLPHRVWKVQFVGAFLSTLKSHNIKEKTVMCSFILQVKVWTIMVVDTVKALQKCAKNYKTVHYRC